METMIPNRKKAPGQNLKKAVAINNLVIALLEIYPDLLTDNPFKDIPFNKPNQHMFMGTRYRALVHAITLVNRKHRRQNKKGSYITQKEDIEAANSIMGTIQTND